MSSLPAAETRSLLLVQLSDSHLSAHPQALYRGENPDENLASLRPAIRELEPDAIVLSGDVSEDASPESYWRMGGFVHDLADEVAWLPGNHDERGTMAEVFDSFGFESGPVLVRGGWQIVLLDSAWPDRPEGELDAGRLAPLDQLEDDLPALVFVHHQPLAIGSPWIDKYPLIEPETFWQRIAARPVEAVAFGHVHQVYEGEHRGVNCLSAPSTVANSHRETEKFTLDENLGPAARWYRLWPDGEWETGLVTARPGRD